MLRAFALLSTLAVGGCGGAVFACQTDVDCGGGRPGGVCAEGGACSFPDDDCTSGQRYGEHAGSLSNQCVPDSATTSGDATTLASSSPTSIDASSTQDASLDTSLEVTTTPTSSASADDSSSTDTSSEGTTGPSIDPDLLVWLRFDASEASMIANDGVLGGSATCLAGCPTLDGGVARFDGQAHCLAFPHHDELAGLPFTTAAWVQIANGTSGMFLFGKAFEAGSQNTWELYVSYALLLGQSLGFEMYGPPDGVVTTNMVAQGVWLHVAGSWDGDVMRLYVDGTQLGEYALAAAASDAHDLQFGCDNDGGSPVYFFDGWMSDVRVYGRALGPEEIGVLATMIPPDPTD